MNKNKLDFGFWISAHVHLILNIINIFMLQKNKYEHLGFIHIVNYPIMFNSIKNYYTDHKICSYNFKTLHICCDIAFNLPYFCFVYVNNKRIHTWYTFSLNYSTCLATSWSPILVAITMIIYYILSFEMPFTLLVMLNNFSYFYCVYVIEGWIIK
jgi:hypothetical protein